MPLMQDRIDTADDDFWTEHLPFFIARFPTYYTKPQKVWGRFHTSDEQYESSRYEIIPISEKKGPRTYVMMQPYVREPKLTLTVALYTQPKHFADQESPIGEVIDTPQVQGFRDSPFNMCVVVATPNLDTVSQRNCRQEPDTRMTVMCRRFSCSSSNIDVERADL
jgi:hypothetical protein